MIYRIFSRSFLALRLSLLLLLLLFSILLLLLSTESGSRFLLQKIGQYTPGFSLEGSKGSFLHGLDLEKPRYQYQGITVYAHAIHLSIHPLVLLRGQLRVAQLRSQGLHLIINTDDNSTEPSAAITSLPAIATPLAIKIKNLQLDNSQLSINHQTWPIHSINAQLSWWQHNLQIVQLQAETSEQQLAAEGNLRMHKNWPLAIQLQWQSIVPENIASIVDSRTAQGQLSASGTLLDIQLEQTLTLGQQPPIKNQLGIQAFAVPMQFTLATQWPTLALQLPQQRLHLKQGDLLISGSLDDYLLQLQSNIQLEQQPTARLQLAAQGSTQALEKIRLTLSEQQQQLRLEGNLHWLPELRWRVKGDAQHINPSLWIAELDGDISAQLYSEGQWGDDKQIQFAIEQLSGSLAQQALSGYSRIHWRKQQGVYSDTMLNSGSNHLLAKGELSHDKLDFTLAINSEDLSQVSAQLGGAIQLSASLSGTSQQPQLHGKGQAHHIRFADTHISRILLNADSPDSKNLNSLLQLETIKQGDTLVADTLSLQSNGDSYQQQWQLDIRRDNDTLFALLNNHWQDGKGQATLQHLEISSDAIGLWSLEKPTTAHYTKQQFDLANSCLKQHQQQGQFCFQAQKLQQDVQASIDLSHLDLAPFAPYIANDIEVYARLNAELSLHKTPQQLGGKLAIQSTPGYLRYISDGEEIARVSWQDSQLQGQLEGNDYQAAIDIRLDDSNWLKQSLEGNIKSHAIAGRLQLQLTQLQLLELISPIRQLDGEINGDIVLSGSLEAPEAQGQIEFLAHSLLVPDAGLQIDNMRVRLQADKQQFIRLDGELYSGGQALILEGSADTQKPFPWPISLHAHGKDFLALNLDTMRLRIDPDLYIDINNQWIKTRGEIHVREAQVKLRDLPATAHSPSSDTIIIGEEKKQTPWFIDSDINITLGDNFSVQGMGLDAKFGGDLRIQDAPQQALSLTGLVDVAEGRYRAYGQNLVIERGQVFFQGPADDPGLDILATRTLSKHNVKVGLEIGGTLKYPRTRVFSDPLMDETEAMSWLLFGKPLSGASENDGTLILQAVAVYGIEQGDFITQNLSDKLGLDVGFDTAGENDQTAFTLGKQLSARIYLRYSVGLFDNLSTLMVRYQLSQHMHLETQSTGDANSIDLQYKLER